MELASRLHLPLQECKHKTTAREFIKWLRFFQEKDRAEWEQKQKWEHYAAQISANILRAAGCKNVQVKDHYIRFKSGQRKMTEKVRTVTREQRAKEAKAFWSAFFAAHGTDAKPLKSKKEPE